MPSGSSADIGAPLALPSPVPPIVQFNADPDVIDLAWGHPDPDLLPTDLIANATRRALDRYGPDALAYGAAHGAGPLRVAMADHLEHVDGRRPRIEEILITAGTSSGLDQAVTLLTDPGDVILVESPTYHLALRIFRDHPLKVVPVSAGLEGLDVGELRRIARKLRRQGRKPRLVYAVTTFANPTGATINGADRERLAEALDSEDLILLEDDTYRELWYDEAPPASVWSIADGHRVVRLGTFSKTLAPGLRLGYLTASPRLIDTFASGGVLDSGGGNAHFVALMVGELVESGQYAALLEELRASYRIRRDALTTELQSLGFEYRYPAGGYFVWIELGPPAGPRALELARKEGTSFVPGEVFLAEPAPSSKARLSFSRYPPATLREGARRLHDALTGA